MGASGRKIHTEELTKHSFIERQQLYEKKHNMKMQSRESEVENKFSYKPSVYSKYKKYLNVESKVKLATIQRHKYGNSMDFDASMVSKLDRLNAAGDEEAQFALHSRRESKNYIVYDKIPLLMTTREGDGMAQVVEIDETNDDLKPALLIN